MLKENRTGFFFLYVDKNKSLCDGEEFIYFSFFFFFSILRKKDDNKNVYEKNKRFFSKENTCSTSFVCTVNNKDRPEMLKKKNC